MTDEKLREVIKGLPIVNCPSVVSERIVAAIAHEPQAPPARRPTTVHWWAWTAPLAAAAALAVVLLATRPDPAPRYSPAEVATARAQAIESLSTVMTMIQNTQREAVIEVLGRQVPGTLRTSVQKALQMSEGGQG